MGGKRTLALVCVCVRQRLALFSVECQRRKARGRGREAVVDCRRSWEEAAAHGTSVERSEKAATLALPRVPAGRRRGLSPRSCSERAAKAATLASSRLRAGIGGCFSEQRRNEGRSEKVVTLASSRLRAGREEVFLSRGGAGGGLEDCEAGSVAASRESKRCLCLRRRSG